jgi:hypothetical protein
MSLLELYNKYTHASKTKRYAKEICNAYNERTGRNINYGTFGRVLGTYRRRFQGYDATDEHLLVCLSNLIKDEIFPLHKCGPSEEEWVRRAKDRVCRLQERLDEYLVGTTQTSTTTTRSDEEIERFNRYTDNTAACIDTYCAFRYTDGSMQDILRDELCELFNLENGESVSTSDFAEYVKLIFPVEYPDNYLNFFGKIDRYIMALRRGDVEMDMDGNVTGVGRFV